MVEIYCRLVGARIRADWQYRASFLLFTGGQAMALCLDLLAIVVVFTQVSSLAGWSFDEVLVLYGTSAIAFGLGDVFVSPVEKAALHIKLGTFDRFLLRPVGPLLHLCCEEFALRRVGKLIPPSIVLFTALARLGLPWTPARAIVLAGTIAAGTVIFSALWVITSSMAFWT
ncbi:MAG: ABC transporter permease, partial [Acidimicrobiales bacterium]